MDGGREKRKAYSRDEGCFSFNAVFLRVLPKSSYLELPVWTRELLNLPTRTRITDADARRLPERLEIAIRLRWAGTWLGEVGIGEEHGRAAVC